MVTNEDISAIGGDSMSRREVQMSPATVTNTKGGLLRRIVRWLDELATSAMLEEVPVRSDDPSHDAQEAKGRGEYYLHTLTGR